MDRKLILAVFIVCLMVGTVWADVPSLIHYQGELADAGGEPVSAAKSMTFEFRDAPAAGTLLGGFSETQSVAVSDGVFNVLIGSATVGGVPQSIFAGSNVYLSVTVEGEELTPRQRLVSVGFAFKAAEADHAATADTVPALEARVAALEALLAGVTRNGDDIVYSGVNVRINNGLGSTATINGLGNLIVGYNEERGGGDDDRSGSHNIVVGRRNNFTRYGGLVAGYRNTISGSYASVSGGISNEASGNYSSVSGGDGNTASGGGSSVSGGRANTASYADSSVSGGVSNEASGWYSSVSGGRGNQAIGEASSVSGGNSGAANGNYSSVSGGFLSGATGDWSSVISGYLNTASGSYSSVSGGYNNRARGWGSSVSGGYNRSVDNTYDWRAGSLFEDN